MDALTLFGLFAVTAMLVCYALEDRSHWYVLGFASACALGSIYGFLAVRHRGSHLGARRPEAMATHPELRCCHGASSTLCDMEGGCTPNWQLV